MPAHSRFLSYFLAVARHGSIRKASEELHIAASAVDRQIRLGEENLGAALFDRLPGGLQLTSAGEILLWQAKRWSKELDSVRFRIDELHGLRRGSTKIAVVDALSRGVLPRLVASVRAEHPFIALDINVAGNRAITEAVVSGEVDLGLIINPVRSRDILVRSVVDCPLGFVTWPDHALVGQPSVRASAAAEEAIIAPQEPLALSEQVGIIEATSGIVFRRVVKSDSIQLIKSLIRERAGIGILCSLDVADEVERGELAFIRIENSGLRPLALTLCIHPSRQISAAGNLLISRIEKELFDIGGV